MFCYVKIELERKVAVFVCMCEKILNVLLCLSILTVCLNISRFYVLNVVMVGLFTTLLHVIIPPRLVTVTLYLNLN